MTAALDPRGRRGYLDWMRGLAVLVMIEAHLLDSWTRVPDRETQQFDWAMLVGGFGAPMFLFLAGAVVSLSAGAKVRQPADVKSASRSVARRGLEIFGLAFLFRLQAWILGLGPARTLLKVDIPLHKSLSLWQACGAFVLFTAFLLGCSLAKDRAIQLWRAARPLPSASRERPAMGL